MAWWPRQTPRSGMAFDSAAAIISIVRPAARAGRDQDRAGAPRYDSLRVEPVVARDDDVRIELPHRLHEVVGERIVVVDEENHRNTVKRKTSNVKRSTLSSPVSRFTVYVSRLTPHSRAISTARKSAAALDSASRYSRSGIESATMPAPAWIRQRPIRF